MILDEVRARDILDAAHAAWSRGDVEGVLSQYVDDLTYWSNTGAPDGGPLTIVGKMALRAFLESIGDGLGRAKIECFIRHKQTGHTLVGSYRQVITFRGDKILRVDEYHDAAKMAAFWRLIAGETVERSLAIKRQRCLPER